VAPAVSTPVPERGEPLYRVHLATGVVTTIDSARSERLEGDLEAKINGDRLHVRRLDRIVVDRPARGAFDVAWQIRRGDMLYVSLFRHDSQIYEALRPGQNEAVWSRVVANDHVDATHGAFPTTTGPLILHTWYSITAIRTEDGSTLWTVPWPDNGSPAKVVDAGASLIACAQDIVALAPATGQVRWQRKSHGELAECTLVGRNLLVATRTCDDKACTPKDNFVLDADTGAVLYTQPSPPPRVLAVTDRDHALVEVPNGAAMLDARTGTLGGTLALSGFLSAERLPEGDVLVRGERTTRLAVEPLSIRWQAPDAYSERAGQFLVGTRSDVPAGKSTVVLIDTASGVEREAELPTMRPPGDFPWERGGAFVVGTSPTDVDIAIRFGHLD